MNEYLYIYIRKLIEKEGGQSFLTPLPFVEEEAAATRAGCTQLGQIAARGKRDKCQRF